MEVVAAVTSAVLLHKAGVFRLREETQILVVALGAAGAGELLLAASVAILAS